MSMASIYIFFFALLVQMALGANLVNDCKTDSGNFTSDNIYKTNLKNLLRGLKSKTPATGFSTGAAGQSPDQVFGLAQCRGDISVRDCRACINEAIRDSRELCPTSKAAMLWYDTCYLRYSNDTFSGIVDSSGSGAILPNLQNATDGFTQSAISLLGNLSQEASVAPKLFGAGEINLENSEKISGFVDCTRDLSSFECKICIDTLVDALHDDENVIGTRVGGRILTGSCNIRYETFTFFKSNSTA